MKNVFLLFKSDLQSLKSNVITLIIAIGLVTIPSLFSWYNLLACWDVFDNTGRLTVAVANSDEGYKSDLVPIKIDMGEQVVSALRANDQLHWVFVDEEEALDGAKSGRYYAAVVIPESFSRDMMSFFSSDATSADLIYYSNEKINAIAPRMLDIGADEVSQEVNKVFEETLSEIALGTSAALYDYADQADAAGQVGNLANHISNLGERLENSAAALDAYGAVFESVRILIDNSDNLINQATQSSNDIASSVESSIQSTKDALSALETSTNSLENLISDTNAQSEAAKTALNNAFDQNLAAAEQAEKSLRDLANLATTAGNAEAARWLTEAADAIKASSDATQSARQGLTQRLDSIYEEWSVVKKSYDEELKPLFDKLNDTFTRTGNAITETTTLLDALDSDLSGATDSLSVKLTQSRDKAQNASAEISDAGQKLKSMGSQLALALATGDGAAIRSVIGSDPTTFAENLAAPVKIDRIAVYPVDNFGSAMTPLYTSLALWIGALLIMVALKTRPSESTLRKLHDPTERQIFFGRFGIVALISILQSTLLSVGNLLFIGVQAVHPFLYILCYWVCGLVFTFIIYTLVSLLANLGKALGVIFLVIQIAGGGGSYPLALLPEAVQEISPFLPVTHAVDAMRSAMFGIYQNDFWIDLLLLILFIVPLLLMVLFLIKPLRKIVPRFLERVEKSKLM